MKNNSKKYDSTVSFGGNKRADVEFGAKCMFRSSFLWIEVDHRNTEFIVFVDDKVNPDHIAEFKEEFEQVKIKIFKEISLADLRNPSRPIAAH